MLGVFMRCTYRMKYDSTCPGCGKDVHKGDSPHEHMFLPYAQPGYTVFHKACAEIATVDLVRACRGE